jgi:hypothetical protein
MPTTLEQAAASSGTEADVRSPYQRRERRYAIPSGMRLMIRTTGQDQPVAVELRDISRNGVGLKSPKLIAPGAAIDFPFGSQRVFAQVRYCCRTRTGFLVGALILEVVAQNGALSKTLEV